ncbi:MAG: hypothetical protein NVS3B19_07670 [Ginsengibacter sp.]
MAARRDFFLFFKEAVNNLAKYSNSKTALIKLHLLDYKLILQVKDDGDGFDLNDQREGNGIANMKKRASNLKGKFKINTGLKTGTDIELEVPLY